MLLHKTLWINLCLKILLKCSLYMTMDVSVCGPLFMYTPCFRKKTCGYLNSGVSHAISLLQTIGPQNTRYVTPYFKNNRTSFMCFGATFQ
jgi:hypothetical protein